MSTQEKPKENAAEYTPLEMPDTVPGANATDFPEINEFLKNMKLRGSMFGFQKEDVYEKMQKMNSMYQSRFQQLRDQLRGQLKQIRRQQQEELAGLKEGFEKERGELKLSLEQKDKEYKEQLLALKQAQAGAESRLEQEHAI